MCGYFCIGFIDFMFTGKTLIDYISLFSPCNLKKMIVWFWNIVKIIESNPIETIYRTNLTDKTKFIFNEISKIENYFNQKIKERKLNSKKLSKYVAAFD